MFRVQKAIGVRYGFYISFPLAVSLVFLDIFLLRQVLRAGASCNLTNESMLLLALNITVWDGHEVFSSVPRLTGWSFRRLVYVPLRKSGTPHSLRRSCGFPHTQDAKRTAPSESAELVAGHQSKQKRPHDLPDIAHYFMLSVVTE